MLGYYGLLRSPPLGFEGAYSIRLSCQGREVPPTAVIRGKPDPCILNKLSQSYARSIACNWECQVPSSTSSTYIELLILAINGKRLLAVFSHQDSNNSRLIRFESSFDGRRALLDGEGSLVLLLASGPPCTDDGLLCTATCERYRELEQVLNRPYPEQMDPWRSAAFWSAFLCLLLGGISGSSSCYFQDAICQQMVQQQQHREEDFGHQRLWASVGWGLSSVLVGYLVDRDSRQSINFDYSTPLIIFVVLMMADVVVVGFWKVARTSLCSNLYTSI